MLDDASADVLRLTADIDNVLAGRSPGLVRKLGTARFPAGPQAPGMRPDETHFEWLASELSHQAGQRRTGGRIGAEQTAGWVRKAKRERQLLRVRHATSWLLALAVAGGIVGLSAYVLLGRVPGAEEIAILAQKMWL